MVYMLLSFLISNWPCCISFFAAVWGCRPVLTSKSGAKLLLFFELCKKMYLKKEFCNPLNNSNLHICVFEK